MIASMGGMAASGGYYVSAPATKIIAEPGAHACEVLGFRVQARM